MNSKFTVCALLTLLLVLKPAIGAAPSCDAVITSFAPCLSYLKNTDAVPSTGCCDNVKVLDQQLPEKQDRKSVCQCIKLVVPIIGAVNNTRVEDVSNNCGSKHYTFPLISPDMNCDNFCASTVRTCVQQRLSVLFP
ncbi:hypothetical protein MKW94_026481 [Papaver nudicaule]|uniref:Bifunctional inhibitor/plant lipid transfer protein/seed storage helical domain-containing protein n=1 Tax=Papaver nudicaule TaxID=74823 RepID=A0AA41SAF5_PAPNU|nr:hypothetical protein [Papaver nudicaule]